MGDCIGMRADHALLFAREQDEADAATWTNAGVFDGPKRVYDQRGVAAVVERAGAELPRIKMRS